MKTRLAALAIGFLTAGNILAGSPGTISFGSRCHKVFPATDHIPEMTYIELPVTITNTSTETISFGTHPNPTFTEFLRRRKNSRHWSDITLSGGCGLGYSVRQLAAGASFDSTILIRKEYGGHGFRVELEMAQDASYRGPRIKIKSPAIMLPKTED